MFRAIFLLLNVMLSSFSEARIRTWMRNTNVLNPENWYQDTECDGLVFAENLGGIMTLDTVTVNKIRLPFNGQIVINDFAKIRIDAKDKKCIDVKPVQFYDLYDPDNWDKLPNLAIPDMERLPCSYDDIVFPENTTFAFEPSYSMLDVRSLTAFGRKFSNDDWTNFYYSTKGNYQFRRRGEYYGGNLVTIKSTVCDKIDTCQCQAGAYSYEYTVCMSVHMRAKEPKCHDPIKPSGQCSPLCGAFITFNADPAYFKKYKFVDYMKQYDDDVHYYISQVINMTYNYKQTQLVLVDRVEFSRKAELIAKEIQAFFNAGGGQFHIIKSFLFVSGNPKNGAEVAAVAFGIIFGTLLMTLILFTVIYVVYLGPVKVRNFTIKLPSRSSFQPFVFAKFDNRTGGGLSFERSMPGSIISLDKSFDNPLYGIASTSCQTLQSKVDDDEEVAEEVEEENAIGKMHGMVDARPEVAAAPDAEQMELIEDI